MLKYAILGFLRYTPMTGYQIKQFMDNSTSNFWSAKLSQIYVTLKSLEKEGLVESMIFEQEKRPDCRMYFIKEAGEKALDGWLRDMTYQPPQEKDAGMLKLFFCGQLEKETILERLQIQRRETLKNIETYRGETVDEIRQIVEAVPQLARDSLLWNATRRAGEILEEAYLRWLDETIEMVKREFPDEGDIK
ncbi:MAG: PadR family transcriptional regulator [Chloroflexi bacterium]|nr:PadR family transcriptional regulator [Chloroflexota bacterium]MCA2000771.1 PadR family transcriptional regulator [Chloroflexota bacterium]